MSPDETGDGGGSDGDVASGDGSAVEAVVEAAIDSAVDDVVESEDGAGDPPSDFGAFCDGKQ